MPDSAVVLLSAGLDSTYNLYRAKEQFSIKMALTVDYGQQSAKREIHAARQIAHLLQIPHNIVSAHWFKEFTKSSLLTGKDVPLGEAVQIDNLTRSLETAKRVWVPNRNGILLNIAAGFAEGLGAKFVIPGFNYEEAQTFPDNSQSFLKALEAAWNFSTESAVRPMCFSVDMTKTQIVRESLRLKVPLTELWPCYLDDETWCGKCESCQRFKRAVEANGLNYQELQGRDV
jgi:7-cyano-7-deazaguanine synthase